jgi:tetratricopeptide (TPR) repeat protein
VAEVKQLALARGFTIQQGNCFEQDLALPYAPLIDLLAGHDNHALSAELVALRASHFIQRADDSEQSKRGLLEAFANYLPSYSTHPLLLIVEDLHWCDEATLDFLLFFLRRLADQPLLLVGTLRPDEITPVLERWLAAVERTRLATELSLKPLTRLETGELVRAIFDLPRPPQSDFVVALHELSDGNPFFIEEVLKTCVAAGEIFQLGGQWGRKPLSQFQIPRTVQLAVQQRMAQLTPDARAILTLAAVIGQRWSFELLMHLSKQDEHRLVTLLKEGVAAQLVVEESPDHFAFRHALTRQAVYQTLLARERRQHHRIIAERLEQMPANLTHHATLAHHFEAAGVWEKTLFYAQRAGAEAEAIHAPRAVVEQFSRALAAVAQLGRSPSLHLLHGRGRAYEMLGNFAAALADLEAALAAAQQDSEPKMVWQLLLDLGFLWTSRDFGRARDFFDQALAVARTLEDARTLAHTLNRIGNWHVNMEQPQQGQGYHQEALTIFTALGDEAGVAATLDLLAGAVHLGGDVQQGMTLYTRAAEGFRTLGDRRGLASALAWLAYRSAMPLNTSVAVVPLHESIALVEEARQLASEIDWLPGEVFAMLVLAFAHGARGDYGRAIELGEAGLATTRGLEHGWATMAGIVLGALYLDLGDFVAARQRLSEALALAQEWQIHFATHLATTYIALTHLRQQEYALAERLLNDAFGSPALPAQTESLTLQQRLYWFVRAELLLHSGDPGAALAICVRLMAVPVDGAGE